MTQFYDEEIAKNREAFEKIPEEKKPTLIAAMITAGVYQDLNPDEDKK